MGYIFRRAEPADARGVYEVAESVSRKNMEAAGADKETLGKEGFLLYPLSINGPGPNYEERIDLSSHFWVAENEKNQQIVAFMMAYTFLQYRQMIQLTKNDLGVLEFFVNHPGVDRAKYEESNIYVAQVATHADLKRQHIMRELANHAFNNTGDAPSAIAEIAQRPLRNIASSEFFKSIGFSMPWIRPKDNGERISGTFVRTFAPHI